MSLQFFDDMKWCKNPEQWLNPGKICTHLKVLSESYPMNTSRVKTVYKNLCALVLWMKVASVLEGLKNNFFIWVLRDDECDPWCTYHHMVRVCIDNGTPLSGGWKGYPSTFRQTSWTGGVSCLEAVLQAVLAPSHTGRAEEWQIQLPRNTPEGET